jgi:vancomycin resistance protein YoaR
MRLPRLSLLIALSAVVGGAAGAVAVVVRHADALGPDALLDGRTVPVDSALDTFVTEQSHRIGERTVLLDARDELIPTTLAELGVELDLLSTATEARRTPARRSLYQRIRRVLNGPPKDPWIVTPQFTLDEQQARRKLERLAPALRRTPVDARLDLEQHRRIDDASGRDLDIDATLIQIERSSYEEDSTIPLVFHYSPAKVAGRELPPIDVSRVLSSFRTSFAKRGGARAVNIRRGAELLNGATVVPGEIFSFNGTVGPRTYQRGFVTAPVIVHDEIDKGPGGGICQVASTVHAAAVYAGLEVLERRSHSRPSGYAPLGLDATVIDNKVDLRLRNPYDTALMIHAYLPTRSTIEVEFLGRDPPGPVVHEAQVIKRTPFLRRIVEKADLAPGDFKRSQKGAYGYDIISTVSLSLTDGTKSTRHYKSNYYPVPEVFWVGPGTPAATLPPLPDGAQGIEPEAADPE